MGGLTVELTPAYVYLIFIAQDGDSVELYLAKHTVTLSLVTTTVTVTADTKAFAARLVYAMSLALHQTQIL